MCTTADRSTLAWLDTIVLHVCLAGRIQGLHTAAPASQGGACCRDRLPWELPSLLQQQPVTPPGMHLLPTSIAPSRMAPASLTNHATCANRRRTGESKQIGSTPSDIIVQVTFAQDAARKLATAGQLGSDKMHPRDRAALAGHAIPLKLHRNDQTCWEIEQQFNGCHEV